MLGELSSYLSSHSEGSGEREVHLDQEASLLWVTLAALKAPSLRSKETEAWEENLLTQTPILPQPPVLHRSEHRNCGMHLGDLVLNKAAAYYMA